MMTGWAMTLSVIALAVSTPESLPDAINANGIAGLIFAVGSVFSVICVTALTQTNLPLPQSSQLAGRTPRPFLNAPFKSRPRAVPSPESNALETTNPTSHGATA